MSLELLLEKATKSGAIGKIHYPQYTTSENFPVTDVRGEPSVVSLAGIGLRLSQFIYCGDIIEAMCDLDLLPGSMSELVHYSSLWDGLTSVLALGSIWSEHAGDYYAGCLCLGSDGPELSLRDVDFGWSHNDFFLAIRKH